jgi:hypothetical protein
VPALLDAALARATGVALIHGVVSLVIRRTPPGVGLARIQSTSTGCRPVTSSDCTRTVDAVLGAARDQSTP